jgi:pyocin large subunit-like protein
LFVHVHTEEGIMQRILTGVLTAAVLASLAGCDSGAKAVTPQVSSGIEEAARSLPARTLPRLAGKPMWAQSKSRSAEAGAEAQFQRNGADFGSATVEDYIAEAHAFASKPPKGTQMTTRRNGDVLLYDPVGNVFAVVTADGAPRTLFKPKDGAAYWAKQKASAQQQAKVRAATQAG